MDVPAAAVQASAPLAVLPASLLAEPTYHMAAVTPLPPGDVDAGGTNASARLAPARYELSPEAASIDTTRLTPALLEMHLQQMHARVAAHGPAPAAGASAITAAVFTPAQIRAAYGLPPLPAAGMSLTGTTATALGAGQTVYIVDAYDNPNAFADLNTFSTTFGLPTCTRAVITPASPMPLSRPGPGCEFDVAYPSAAGVAGAAAPVYSAGWSPEIALDVQWVHAMAPLARIVLLESASASVSDLMGSVLLANRMGPGVVSMSFGAGEGSWVPGADAYFTAAGMTYLASTGDSGAGVSWPAVSSKVLAVGGTSMNYSPTAPRNEAAWSGSGGGISAFESLPAYQSGVSIAGGGTLHSRAVADIAFNADPNTGQYVVITPPGGSAGWYIYGGTSISSPQWAGILALVNAARAAGGQPMLADVHAALYGQIAAVPGNYAAALADITLGADGSCATCKAAAGYDQATGWGTPNFASLLTLLGAAQTLPPLPAATMPGGTAGQPYATQWAATDAAHGALSYSASGAPAGLAVGTSGAISWSKPLAGTYAFSVTVRNIAGATATGTVTLTIAPAPAAPTVPGGAILARTASALSVSLGIVVPPNSGTIAYAISGAPAGLAIGAAGVLTWPKTAAGIYRLQVTATNAFGASASGIYTLTVDGAPVVPGGRITGSTAAALAAGVGATDPIGSALTFSLSGAPAGLGISASGTLAWASPVRGVYTIGVTARNGVGLSATGSYVLTINAPPVIAATSINAAAGHALTASIGASDPNGSSLSFTMSGAPSGLVLGSSGTLSWSAPVKGSYTLVVTARDALGMATTARITLVVN